MRYLAILLLLTGCTNPLLTRNQQLEEQRDRAIEMAKVCEKEKSVLTEYLGACIFLYKECDGKLIKN